MNSRIQCSLLKGLLMPFCLLICLFLFHFKSNAQEKPPRPIAVEVEMAQQLNFGKFIPFGINQETITVDFNGMRSCSVGIILVGFISSPARFKVDAEPGTEIRIDNSQPATLYGSNGGFLSLKLGDSSSGSRFRTNSQTTYISIGGTLTVGPLSANPAGLYSGTFLVTFIQE